MKIGNALAQKKKMQVRLAKCNDLLEKSYYYKNKPDFDYHKLRDEISSLTIQITDLKVQIMKTNLAITVIPTKLPMTLAELIIRLGDIRADISTLSKLYNSSDNLFSLRYNTEQESKPQVPPNEVENEISRLNTEKTELDALLQHTNWTTELL